ncbi:MAG: hypothetical protein KDK70_12725, partial [Myxococcales bacterium]|nr:hypothetical protein [Myxococcales bacterium]
MTTSHHDPRLASSVGPPSADAERIAAELLALGEDALDDDELAFVATTAHDDPDVRTVATLVDLSTWQAPAEGLLPLERHRVWRSIAQRALAPAASRVDAFEVAEVAEPTEPAANGGSGWRGLVAGLALVAGVALLPRFDAPPAPTA